MERKRKNFDQAPLIGGSSLLVIFAVLCLTVFAVLTVSSALADKRLGDASAEHVRAYYEADLKAEEILAGLRSGTVPEGVSGENGKYSYTVGISPVQELYVEVEVQGNDYKVSRWQSVPVGPNWNPDDSLNVWNGAQDPEMSGEGALWN